MTNLRDGLNRLHDTALAMARTDGRDVLARFGQLGGRRLAVAG
jgi:hypothetical protein